MHIVVAIVVSGGLALLVWWLTLGRTRKPRGVEDLRQKLRQMTRDPAVADRLVAGVKRRNPELSEAACYRRAITSLGYSSQR